MFCTIAGNERWTLEGSDVRAAFLQSDKLDREIFVEPPPERTKPGVVWKLLKPSYGLKDASKKWFQSTVNTLKSLGMKQSFRDACLFYFQENEVLQGLMIVHVDDFLVLWIRSF